MESMEWEEVIALTCLDMEIWDDGNQNLGMGILSVIYFNSDGKEGEMAKKMIDLVLKMGVFFFKSF